jgi:hypothetical protein
MREIQVHCECCRHSINLAGVQILDLICDGVTNAQTLAASVRTKIKRKDEAQKALTNCLMNGHIFALNELMGQYRDLRERILRIENEMTEKMLRVCAPDRKDVSI